MNEKWTKRLRRLSERQWFLLALFGSVLLGSFFERGRMALQLYCVLPWAAGLCYSQLRGRRMARTAANGFLLAGALVLTAACAYRSAFDMPRWLALAGMGVYALVVSQPEGGPKALRGELRVVAALLVICVTPMMLLGVASVFAGRPFQFLNEKIPVGITGAGELTSRIQVLGNTNTAARSSVLAVILAVYLLCVSRRRWIKALLAVSIVILTMALAHTQSRTGLVAYGAAAGAMAFRGIWLKLEGRKGRWAAALLAALAAAGIAMAGVNLVYSVDIRIASALQARRTAGMEAEAVDAVSRAVSSDVIYPEGSGRLEIWRNVAAYLKSHPKTFLVGLGTGNIVHQVVDASSLEANTAHLHNSLLECLVRGGVPLLICAVGYLCALVKPAARALTAREPEVRRGEWVLAVLVGVLTVMSMTENTIYTSGAWANGLFFLAAGWLLNEKTEAEESE